MNPENYIEEVEKQFKEMQSIEDFALLLQFIYNQLDKHRKKDIKIKVNVLTYYGYVLKNGEGYIDFEIKKKSGGMRKISSPKYVLKLIQQCILEILSIAYSPHRAAHGFVLGKNVATNATAHIGKKFVFNIDIKDFFPSTSFHKIKFLLTLKPFYLTGKRAEIAQLIANLCCKNGYLPQGSPASPILTNIVCRRIDARLTQLAKKYRARYTRYADDISFSCNKNIFNDDFLKEVTKILRDDKYEINDKKTRLNKSYQRQEVTGVVVNQKANLPREYIKDIRYWLFAWEKFGEDRTQMDFERRFPEKKGFNRYNGVSIKFTNYLYGKIQYLKMIRGEGDIMVNRFLDKYDSLLEIGFEDYDKKVNFETDNILNDMEGSISNQLSTIRSALEIRGNFTIKYEFIKESHWRKQLQSDNLKMENCAIRNIGDDGRLNNTNSAFNDVCGYACFQIELLLNIYFKKRFPNWSDLIHEINNLKNDGKLAQDYIPRSYNKTIRALSLSTKFHLYSVLYSLFQTDMYKGINAIREIRNVKVAHRPAEDNTPISEPREILKSNLNIRELREVLIQNGRIGPIRYYLKTFVKHIEKHMPK